VTNQLHLQTGVVQPHNYLYSTARIRQDISAASFCSCKFPGRSDERVLLSCFNAQPDIFCSYELLHHSVNCIFLRCASLEGWKFIFSKGVRKGELGLTTPLGLIFYENLIICAKEI